MRIKIRYLSPLYPFIFATISIAINSLLKAKKVLLVSFIIFLLLSNTCDLQRRLAYFGFKQGFKYYGYWYFHDIGDALVARHYDVDRLRNVLPRNNDEKIGVIFGYLNHSKDPISIYTDLVKIALINKNEQNILKRRFKNWFYDFIYHKRHTPSAMDGLINAIIKSYRPNEKFIKTGVSLESFNVSGIERIKSIMDAFHFNEDDRVIIYECLGVLAAHPHYSSFLDSFLNNIEEKYIPSFLNGVGYGIKSMITLDLPNTIGDVNIFFEGLFNVVTKFVNLKEEYKGYIYKGYVSNRYVFNICDLEDDYFLPSLDLSAVFFYINNKIDNFYRPYIYSGIGEGLGLETSYRRLQFERTLFFLTKINKIYKPYAFEGFGRGVKFMFKDNYVKKDDLIQKIPPVYRKNFLEGIEE